MSGRLQEARAERGPGWEGLSASDQSAFPHEDTAQMHTGAAVLFYKIKFINISPLSQVLSCPPHHRLTFYFFKIPIIFIFKS